MTLSTHSRAESSSTLSSCGKMGRPGSWHADDGLPVLRPQLETAMEKAKRYRAARDFLPGGQKPAPFRKSPGRSDARFPSTYAPGGAGGAGYERCRGMERGRYRSRGTLGKIFERRWEPCLSC